MPEFLGSPILALRWKQFFQGLTMIWSNMVNLFYKWYINVDDYIEVKGQKVDFRLKAINELYGLENNEIGNKIFKNLKEQNLEMVLQRVAWPRTKWDRTPTEKYQLFPHNLNTTANVWMVFIKNNIMPTRHDNTISLEMILLVCCIMIEIPVNICKIICEHLTTWVKYPWGAKLFPHFIEKAQH